MKGEEIEWGGPIEIDGNRLKVAWIGVTLVRCELKRR